LPTKKKKTQAQGAVTGARLLRAVRPSGGTSLSAATRPRAAATCHPARNARRVRAAGKKNMPVSKIHALLQILNS